MPHIVYRGQKYTRVVINISGTAQFHEILKQLNDLAIPEIPQDDEHIRYALLELINNSVRAHREMNRDEVITTELWMEDDRLKISIVDKGGGFDINLLPYDFNQGADMIDTEDREFQKYRERNQYKRFGMGLVIGRRLFPEFKVSFYDENGSTVDYEPGNVLGTRIEMGIGLSHV